MHGLYVHIPFCPQKCHYCDFNSYPLAGQETHPYAGAVLAEIAQVRAELPEPLPVFDTVFFGGGTPTTLPSRALGQIVAGLRAAFTVADDAEITTEANPGTVSLQSLMELQEAGFNRISFGVQALDDRLLRVLGRVHSAEEARRGARWAREAGFDNLNLDLMYGLPEQSLEDLERTLDDALALEPSHLSIYSLIVEEGTQFGRRFEAGALPLPDEDTEVAMAETVAERTAAAGYARYEVSNYARPGFECRHNQVYWRNEPYLGFGAGAVSCWDGLRRTNALLPRDYLARVAAGQPLTVAEERLAAPDAVGETLMLGLRTAEGVDLERVRERYGLDPQTLFRRHIARMERLGLLERAGASLRLTDRGFWLANQVWAGFVG